MMGYTKYSVFHLVMTDDNNKPCWFGVFFGFVSCLFVWFGFFCLVWFVWGFIIKKKLLRFFIIKKKIYKRK